VNYLHGSSLQLPHHPVLKYSCFGLVKMLHRYLRCLSGSLRSCPAVLNPFILRSGNTAAERFVFSTRIKHPASFSSPSAVHGLFCRCFLAAGRYVFFVLFDKAFTRIRELALYNVHMYPENLPLVATIIHSQRD
jgi:hypothetical protein